MRIAVKTLLVTAVFLLLCIGSAGAQEPVSIQLTPADTTLTAGTSVQFAAALVDSEGNQVDSAITWQLTNPAIGTLSDSGLFTADSAGQGYVIAGFGDLRDSSLITVAAVSQADTVINTVTIRKIKQNGQLHPQSDMVTEGSGEYKFTGFPSPLNFLNGGSLEFPDGSLDEDITIYIKLPQNVKLEGDTSVTGFDNADSGKSIVSGVEFIVVVNGDTVSPYFFQSPVEVSLPYKHGLLSNLGLNENNLHLGFYSDSVGFDTAGVRNQVMETEKNRIKAGLAHFTTVVLYGEKTTTNVPVTDNTAVPDNYRLYQNYPNPFNPETKIRFFIPKSVNVCLRVFNLLGQEVRMLADRSFEAGYHTAVWDGRSNNGIKVHSGIYFYKLESTGYISVRKMVLLK